MKLTTNQIDELYKFTRKHYVYFYDVQSELVDHLANDMESTWVETPNVSFEEARDKSFKKFGIFGFMDVIEAKQKQMNKRYWKIILRFAKEWFTLPRVVTTAIIFLSIFFFLKIQFSEYILLGSLLIFVVFDLINQFRNRKTQEQKRQKKEKIFLLESMIGDTKGGFTGITLINAFNFLNFSHVSFSTLEIHWSIIVSLIATLLVVLFYVINYIIPQRAEELLAETYPEYKLVNNL
jgi:ABC-type multidrug transport system fused ATPase/permease subunit